MKDLIRRWHIYAGLMTFWALLVFGASASYVTFRADKRDKPKPPIERVAFSPPEGSTDRQAADMMRDRFGLPSTKPVPDWVIARNSDGHLALPLWSPSGVIHVTWLQDEKVALLSRDVYSTGQYINEMHTAVPLGRGAPLQFLWSLYTELSIFTLMFLVLSGVYLWLTTRRHVWWAAASFAAGTAAVVGFFVWVS